MSENEYDTSSVKRAWSLEEEETLIRYILKLKRIKNKHDIHDKALSGCAKAIKRSNKSCYDHWMKVIVPTLKTHFRGLP